MQTVNFIRVVLESPRFRRSSSPEANKSVKMATWTLFLRIEFVFFMLCWCSPDYSVWGSVVVSQTRPNPPFSNSVSSQGVNAGDSDATPILAVGGTRMGSGFKIEKSPSASGLHKLCCDFESNNSSRADASEYHETTIRENNQIKFLDSAANFEFPRKIAEDVALRDPSDATTAACIPLDLVRPLLKVCLPPLMRPCSVFISFLTALDGGMAAVDHRCAALGRRGAHHFRGGRPWPARRGGR